MKTMFGKCFSAKSILLAMFAVFAMSCNDDEFKPEDQDYFVGQWYETFADENIASDGSITFVFAYNAICRVENYNALGDPEHPELSLLKEYGSWIYDEKEKTLSIETEYVHPLTNEPTRVTRVYKISKFANDSFHATHALSSHPQELIFQRETKNYLY